LTEAIREVESQLQSKNIVPGFVTSAVESPIAIHSEPGTFELRKDIERGSIGGSSELAMGYASDSPQNNDDVAVNFVSTEIEETTISCPKRIGNFIRQILYPVDQMFKFKDYLPYEFAQLRELSAIDHGDYATAFKSTTNEKFSEGRSGAFMYFSSDGKYIVKTMSSAEMLPF